MEELEEMLAELHPSSFCWSLSCCAGDRDEAEEVLQTVYLQIVEGRARFGGRSSFKTWLFAVIRRTAAGRRRRARLRRLLRERWAGSEPATAPEPAAEARLALSRRAAAVRHALGLLSRRQREVLELVFYHDLSVRQAAAAMGVSVGSARVHYARGKRELLRRLPPPAAEGGP